MSNAPDETGNARLATNNLAESVARAHAAAGGLDWLDEAACGGHVVETFFPPPSVKAREAESICAGCPVIERCGAYMNEVSVFLTPGGGYGAGTTAAGRMKSRRDAKRAQRADASQA